MAKSKNKKLKAKLKARQDDRTRINAALAAKGTVKAPEGKKGSTRYEPRCHSHDVTMLLTANDEKTRLFAGSKASVTRQIDMGNLKPTLVVNLSGISDDFMADFPIIGNRKAEEIFPSAIFASTEIYEPAIIEVDWTDGGIPHGLDKAWWQTMTDALFATEGDIVILCQGGHGRTGTFLSIVMALGGMVDETGDPMKDLRDVYCESAVESPAQVKYIERMTGRVIQEAASDDYGFPYPVVGGTHHYSGAKTGTSWGPPSNKADGTEDYNIAQHGHQSVFTSPSVPVSVAQGEYLAELEQEELSYGGAQTPAKADETITREYETITDTDGCLSGVREYSVTEADDPTVPEDDFIVDGVHYANEDDFFANEGAHNQRRATDSLERGQTS